MWRLTRTFAYAVLVFSLLGLVSFWFYHSPSQVEQRLRAVIGSSLAVPVTLEACSHDPLGSGLQVGSLRIPAAPPLASRTLLALENLRMEDARGTAFRRALRREPTPPALELTRVRVGRARLVLEHERRSLLDDRVGRWNFESLFRPGTRLADFVRAPAHILVDRLVVFLRRLEAGVRPLEWEVALEAVDVRPSRGSAEETRSDTGLRFEGDLTEGEYWAGGQLRLEVLADGVVDVSGQIEDFRLLSRHLRLVPEAWRRVCSDLDPVGTIDLAIEQLRISSREEPDARIVAHHYDSGMRLGPEGARLEHLRGEMSITEEGVRFGRFAHLEPLEAEMWGVTTRLDGLFSTEQQRLIITLPETNLQDVEFAAGRKAPEPRSGTVNVTGLVDSLGPAGSVQGEIKGDLFTGRSDKWQGSLSFAGFTLRGWPSVHSGSGRIEVRATEDVHGGAIRLERLDLARIGTLSGQIEYSWSESGIRFSSGGLQVARGRTARGAGAAPDGREEPAVRGREGQDGREMPDDNATGNGTLFGTLGWSWEEGVSELDVRWAGLALETELFAARGFAGEIRRSESGLEGVVECRAADIPTLLFGVEGEIWTFERGKGRVIIEHGNVRIPGMKLLGDDWSLRFQGKVHVSGDLDFVVVLAPAEIYAFRVDDLDGKGPETWRETAGSDVRMYRITGTMAHPRVRPMGPFDPAVIR